MGGDKSIWLNRNDLLNCCCRAPSLCAVKVFRDAFVSPVNSQSNLSLPLSACLSLSLSLWTQSPCFFQWRLFLSASTTGLLPSPFVTQNTTKKEKLGQDCENTKATFFFWQCGSFVFFPYGCLAQRKQGHNGHRLQ